MRTTARVRRAAVSFGGGALLLSMAGAAFAAGGGNTAVTSLQGVTFTPVAGMPGCITVSFASAGASFMVGTNTYSISQIGGFFVYSSPQITTVSTPAPPAGYIADTLNGGGVSGATGYDTQSGFSPGSGAFGPGGSATFCFSVAPPAGSKFLLDVFTPNGPFHNTGLISFPGALTPSVPEPSAYAAFLIGGLGVLALTARARRRGVLPTAA